jgi:hypothetical protein
MSQVIIFIHGLDNKPAQGVLTGWCEDSVAEGLRRNLTPNNRPPLQLAYWADIQYAKPLTLADDDEPYVAAQGRGPLPRHDPNLFDKARVFLQKWGGRVIDKGKDLIGLDEPVERLLGVPFRDLRDYYQDAAKRKLMRARLSDLLKQHATDKVCLIAHSMGSIIAYDVLREVEKTAPAKIAHWVTVGSPLGLPIVAFNIRQEFVSTQTPQQVERWTNVADPEDKVAIDCNLHDEYVSNASGVRPHDVLVQNGYVSPQGKKNSHKIYGYLRTPEFSDIIHTFLTA